MVDRKRRILDLLRGRESIQAGQVARSLGVTRQTAHRHLREPVESGVLAVEGAGRATRYRRPERVDAGRYATGRHGRLHPEPFRARHSAVPRIDATDRTAFSDSGPVDTE